MSSKNLSRRLDRLEAELAPAINPEVLTITVTRIGEPDRTIELQLKNRLAGGDHGSRAVGTRRERSPGGSTHRRGAAKRASA